MVLAEIAARAMWEPTIVDFNIVRDIGDSDDPEAFYAFAVSVVLRCAPAVLAITSMGINSHVSLEIARRAKALSPNLFVIAGGVHLSSMAGEMERCFPFVDTLVCGEGEAGFERVLSELSAPTATARCIPPVLRAFQAAAPLHHPFESYSRIALDEYFRRNPRHLVNYEGGRGCVYNCSFCYSPAHYDAVRSVEPRVVAADFARLAAMGTRHVFDVQDNFTNLPRRAIDVCDAIAAERLPLTWNAYVTFPQLSREVAQALGRARCTSVYMGPDAVSERQQLTYNKRTFRSVDNHGKQEELKRKIGWLIENDVHPTISFILDLFQFDIDEIDQSLAMAAFCRTLGASIRINTLTRYLTTGLSHFAQTAPRYSTAKAEISYDCPKVVRENPFATRFPMLFPFHTTEVENEETWRERLLMAWLAQRLLLAHPAELTEIADGGAGSIAGLLLMEAKGVRAPSELIRRFDLDQGSGDNELF